MRVPVLLRTLALLLVVHVPAHAVVQSFEVENAMPPVIEDTTAAATCTVTWLITDIATNDTIAVRMFLPSGPNDRPVDNLLPCPKDIAPRIATRALDTCTTRAADPRTCVYADMARDFLKRPTANNTAENTSRCASDRAREIGIACARPGGEAQVCATACGTAQGEAIAAAVARCETKHQMTCALTGALPVLAPR